MRLITNFYFDFLSVFSLYLTHNGPATNSDDKQPEIKPNVMGIANERSVTRPQTSDTTTIVSTAQTVVTVVTILRTSVLEMLISIFSATESSGYNLLF